MANKFIHTEIRKHPLREAYMVFNISCPFVPPFIGTMKECIEAQKHAERSNENYLKEHGS